MPLSGATLILSLSTRMGPFGRPEASATSFFIPVWNDYNKRAIPICKDTSRLYSGLYTVIGAVPAPTWTAPS